MPLDIGSHSLALLLGVQAAINELQNHELPYGGVVEYTTEVLHSTYAIPKHYQEYDISYSPVNKLLPFYFEVKGIRDSGNGGVDYIYIWKPESSLKAAASAETGNLAEVIAKFQIWAELVAQYNTIHLSRKDRFTAESAQQFYDDFELVDEDATTAPFDNEKQVLVYKLLEFIKDTVERVEDGNQEESNLIVQQIESLQKILPSITKAAVIKELSKVYARVKAYSMKAFVAVYDVAKKELIKHYLYESMDSVSDFIKTFHLPHH